MLFVLIMILIAIATVVLYMFLSWCFVGRHYAKIVYKDFLKYYDIVPHRWYLYAAYVAYRVCAGEYNETREYFRFGFIDFCRYTFWRLGLERSEKRKNHAESIQRMLDDINKMEAQENDEA